MKEDAMVAGETPLRSEESEVDVAEAPVVVSEEVPDDGPRITESDDVLDVAAAASADEARDADDPRATDQAPTEARYADEDEDDADYFGDADEADAEADDHDEIDLLTAVEHVRTHVATLSLTLDVDNAEAARRERESLLSQLDDYLLPRLRRRDAPLLAVIGGSTGAGKSTLTNSLVRREVSRSGVLRPTTRSPVLVHHPYDSGAFLSRRILPRLERITSEGAEPLQPIDANAPRITALRLVPHDGLTPGMAIIDAPDIDSLVETNRDLAVQLLGAADLWLFVTTAARYADATPWDMLKQAADRGVAIAVVLDRVPPEALADLRVHLATRLRDRGLGGAPMFVIPEIDTVDGFLPEEVVEPLQGWLSRVAGDHRSRALIADRTLKGIVSSIPDRMRLLAGAADEQTRGWAALMSDVDRVFTVARVRLLAGLTDGSLVSGEVRARWQDQAADGALTRRISGATPGFGERMTGGEAGVVRALDEPVRAAVDAAVRSAMRSATDEVLRAWRAVPFGAALLEARGHQLGADLSEQVEHSLGGWRDGLVKTASVLAEPGSAETWPNVSVMTDLLFVAAIDERADPEDSTLPVAEARRLVAQYTGEAQLTSAIRPARADLVARAAVLLDAARLRLERLLEAGGVDVRRGEDLRAAADEVERAEP